VVSVPPEVVANAAFQAAPSWLTRPDPPPANDVFRSLVHQSTPGDQPPPPAPHSPAPPATQNHADVSPPPAHHNNPHAATPPTAHHNNPRADNAAAANNNDKNNASGPPPINDNSDSDSNDGLSASVGSNSNTGGSAIKDGNNNGSGASVNGTSPTTTSTSTATSGNSTYGQGDAANTATLADATFLAQQVGNATVALTPIAVAVPTSTPIISTPSGSSSSGGPTAPLAIAAAAIAASSQALASSPGASAQAKSGSDAGASAASTTATAKTIPSLQAGVAKVGTEIALQANAADPSVVTTAALTGTVAGSAPLAPKAQGKTATIAQTTGTTTTNSASVDSSSPVTTTLAGQNAGVAQALNTGKPETPAAGSEPASGVAADATAPTQPVAAHDHAAATNSVHVSADLPDPSAQAVASTQPQFNSASSLGQASNLTVTAAANGPVPIGGVALQIAFNVKNGKSNFEIRLDPPELGRIDVRVQIDQNGQVTSHLTVEKAETLSMLQQDAPQLQQALNDAGLKSGSGGLQFSLRDQSSYGQNSGSGSNPNAHQLIISDEDAVPASIAGLSYGRSPGSGGGFDIRV